MMTVYKNNILLQVIVGLRANKQTLSHVMTSYFASLIVVIIA